MEPYAKSVKEEVLKHEPSLLASEHIQAWRIGPNNFGLNVESICLHPARHVQYPVLSHTKRLLKKRFYRKIGQGEAIQRIVDQHCALATFVWPDRGYVKP